MERMKKQYRFFLLLTCSVVAIFLYGTFQMMKEQKQLKIVYVSKVADTSDFWSALLAGARMAAEEYDIKFSVLAPESEGDVSRQNELVKKAIAMKPDAIAMTPADYKKSIAAAKSIKEHGIKLVFIDSVLKERVADCVIATDNVKGGESLGIYARKIMDAQSRIGMISHVKGSSTAIDREKGVRKGLGEAGSQMKETVFCDSQYSRAYDVTKEMLLRDSKIKLLIGLNEYATVGAARAVKDMGLTGKVKILGFDNSIEEIQLLESGVVEGIVVQKPFDMGYLGITSAVNLINGNVLEKKVDSGSKFVMKESIYTAENQKLLFPFWGKEDER